MGIVRNRSKSKSFKLDNSKGNKKPWILQMSGMWERLAITLKCYQSNGICTKNVGKISRAKRLGLTII